MSPTTNDAPPSSQNTSLTTWGDEVSDNISKEIQQIDHQMRQFTDRRVALLRRLNATKSSTRNLPNEILSLIFFHVCSLTTEEHVELYDQYKNGRFFPIILGSVCFQWRQTAWTSPRLWQFMMACASSHFVYKLAHQIRLYLDNVRSLPFALVLLFPHELGIYRNAAFAAPIADVIFHEDNAKKIDTLSITPVPQEWIPRFNATTFTQLKHITLSWSILHRDYRQQSVTLNAPSLYQLTLLHGEPSVTFAPGTSITALQLHDIPVDICIKLLFQLPNVVDVKIHPDHPSFLGEGPNFTNEKLFPNIENLDWTILPHERWTAALLERIRLPSLYYLRISIFPDIVVNNTDPALSNFFRNHSASEVAELELDSFEGWEVSGFKGIFDDAPHVQILCISGCDSTSLYSVVLALMSEGDSVDQLKCLPNLERLVLNPNQSLTSRPFFTLDEDFSKLLMKMLLGRKDRPFILELKVGFEVNWAPEVKGKLTQAVKDGFDLVIAKDDDVVDWL